VVPLATSVPRDWGEDTIMMTTDAGLLEALADCLESGDTLFEALEKVATAGVRLSIGRTMFVGINDPKLRANF
jgi:hypothetical protein